MTKSLRRLASWLRHRQVQADIDAEIEFHRDATQRALERNGAGRPEAVRESLRAMGNVTLAREDARAVWLPYFMESTWQDIRYALRALARQPGFALLAIGALTAGIGLNTSVFTVYTALAMKPWPVGEPDRVVRMNNQSVLDLRKRAGGAPGGFSQAEVDYLSAHATVLSGVTFVDRTLTVRAAEADVRASWVGGSYFTVLQVPMSAGRAFDAADDLAGSAVPVAVISHSYWQRQFGGDPSVIGRSLRLDGVPFTIVGIAARTFLGTSPERVDVWLPRASAPLLRPEDRWVRLVSQRPANCCSPVAARLAPGVTREQALAELTVLSARFRADRADDRGGVGISGTEVLGDAKGGGAGAVFVPLFTGLSLVLLLACANVGNLLIARGAARGREIAVRLSLGASRRRIVRQLLTESLVLVTLAGAAGLILALWLPVQLVRIAAGGPSALQLQPDRLVLAFTLLTVSVSLVFFGLAPAFHATRRDVMTAIKEGTAAPGTRLSMRSLLLSVQVAAVVVLLASAGVMTRSVLSVVERALPGPLSGLLAVSIQPPVRGYDAARTHAVSLLIEQATDRLPAVLTSTAPLASGNIKGSFRLPDGVDDEFNAVFEVSAGYFRMTGMRIVRGRDFDPGDKGRAVIIINESMARRYWPSSNPIGQHIVCTESGWNMPGTLEIVGVVQDAFMTGMDEVQPTIFQPLTHRGVPQLLVSTRAAADAAVAAVARVDPALRVRVAPLVDVLAPRIRSTEIAALAAGALGALALGFACVGLFGVFAYWVRQRTQEIGVRMALGARSSDVVGLVLRTAAWAVGAGIVFGVAGAAAASRLLHSYLFGLRGIDPATYAAVAVLLTAAALLAAFVPARRATRIDPLVALRYE